MSRTSSSRYAGCSQLQSGPTPTCTFHRRACNLDLVPPIPRAVASAIWTASHLSDALSNRQPGPRPGPAAQPQVPPPPPIPPLPARPAPLRSADQHLRAARGAGGGLSSLDADPFSPPGTGGRMPSRGCNPGGGGGGGGGEFSPTSRDPKDPVPAIAPGGARPYRGGSPAGGQARCGSVRCGAVRCGGWAGGPCRGEARPGLGGILLSEEAVEKCCVSEGKGRG